MSQLVGFDPLVMFGLSVWLVCDVDMVNKSFHCASKLTPDEGVCSYMLLGNQLSRVSS